MGSDKNKVAFNIKTHLHMCMFESKQQQQSLLEDTFCNLALQYNLVFANLNI